jgi:hypothetical protein
MLAMAGGEEMSGCSEPGTVPQKVSQETLGRKNATSGPNEVNPNSGGVQMQPQERNFGTAVSSFLRELDLASRKPVLTQVLQDPNSREFLAT